MLPTYHFKSILNIDINLNEILNLVFVLFNYELNCIFIVIQIFKFNLFHFEQIEKEVKLL